MIPIEFCPLDKWPGDYTTNRKNSPFRSAYASTLTHLDYELTQLKARQVQILIAVNANEIRLDGKLSQAAVVRNPGIVLTFESKHGVLSYPCDAFWNWRDNLRAIALGLQCLRTVERYGISNRGEQYKGFNQLPAPQNPTPTSAIEGAEWMASRSGYSYSDLLNSEERFTAVYRFLAKKLHPDTGGDTREFQTLQEVKTLLDRHFAEARGARL